MGTAPMEYRNPPTSEQVLERLAQFALERPGATASELLEDLAGEAWVSGHNAGGEDARCRCCFGQPDELQVCVREVGHPGDHYDAAHQVFPPPRVETRITRAGGDPAIARGLGDYDSPAIIKPGVQAQNPCGRISQDLVRVCALEVGHAGGHRDAWGMWPQNDFPVCAWKGVSFVCELPKGHTGDHATKDGTQWGGIAGELP